MEMVGMWLIYFRQWNKIYLVFNTMLLKQILQKMALSAISYIGVIVLSNSGIMFEAAPHSAASTVISILTEGLERMMAVLSWTRIVDIT